MNTTFEEKKATDELLAKGAIYLNDNFHKFSQSNKIKISLELIKKKMPTQMEHSGKIDLSSEETNARVARLRNFLTPSEN